MADGEKKEETKVEDPNADPGKAPADPPKGEEDKEKTDWKAKHDEIGFGLRAAQKESEAAAAKIADLEKKLEEPKGDTERIGALEIELARSKAVSRYGLTEEDAERLKGSPDEILKDAEYWATRRKEAEPPKPTEETNREIIDKEIDSPEPAPDGTKPVLKPVAPPVPSAPAPKAGTISWLERFKAATPAERYKMEEDVKAGLVDPHK